MQAPTEPAAPLPRSTNGFGRLVDAGGHSRNGVFVSVDSPEVDFDALDASSQKDGVLDERTLAKAAIWPDTISVLHAVQRRQLAERAGRSCVRNAQVSGVPKILAENKSEQAQQTLRDAAVQERRTVHHFSLQLQPAKAVESQRWLKYMERAANRAASMLFVLSRFLTPKAKGGSLFSMDT